MPPTAASWEVEVGGRRVTLTHPDRVLWPEAGITKAHLVHYYVQAAPLLMAHLAHRPLVLTRYPEGVQGPSFYQKQCPQGAPEWVTTVPIAHGRRTVHYVVADSPATLAWLGNLAAIELHPWLSCARQPDHPDWAVIDLDPDPPSGFEEAREVAFAARELLSRLGLEGTPKLSGATGIHIYLRLPPGTYTYRQTSRFVALLAAVLARAMPRRVTDQRQVQRRGGRVYVDPYQNLRGKTLAGPYSPRPGPGAPVAVPVTWDQLRTVRPDGFTLANLQEWLPARLASGDDPLLQAARRPQRLEAALAVVG